MLMMTETCPNCGEELNIDNAAGGLCGRCLLERGIALASTACLADASTPGTPPFAAPDPIEVEADLLSFDVLELVGQGGMGAVYKARQRNLDRTVAIKILPRQSGGHEFADRFQREARALARLRHDNIVMAYDFGLTDRYSYCVMEYVGGPNLRQYLRSSGESASKLLSPQVGFDDSPWRGRGRERGESEIAKSASQPSPYPLPTRERDTHRLDPRHALEIARDVCTALQFAHENGVVHRDIKPENVLLDETGRVKIADFGLAKLLATDPRELALTQTRHFMGTVHYMAPEQCERPQATDHRADIYSLGVMLYEMLTGELPLGRFELPSSKADVDPRVDQLVLRALEKDPAKRYATAAEFGDAIDELLAAPSLVPGHSAPGLVPAVDAPRPVEHLLAAPSGGRNRRGALIAAGMLGFAAIAFLGWYIFIKYQSNKDGTHVTLDAGSGEQPTKLGSRAARQVDELFQEAAQGRSTQVHELIKSGVDPNSKDRNGETALMKAAANGHASLVVSLIQSGANIAEWDPRGRSALMYAAAAGQSSVIRALEKLRVDRKYQLDLDVDAQDNDGETALMKAAAGGHFECMKILLNLFADASVQDRLGQTALMHLVNNKQATALRQLAANPTKGIGTSIGNYTCSAMLEPEVVAKVNREGKNAIQIADQQKATEMADFLRTEMQRALDHFGRALEKGGPYQFGYHEYRGHAFRALDQTEKADEAFKTAVNLRAASDADGRSTANAKVRKVKLIPLTNVKASKIAEIVQGQFTNSGVEIVTDERTNALLAQGDGEKIDELEALVQRLDKWAAEGKTADAQNSPVQDTRVFALRDLSARDAEGILQKNLPDFTGRIAVDDVSNSVIIGADRETMSKVAALIKRLDEPRTSPEFARIDPGQVLRLRALGTLPDAPIAGMYPVDPDGFVNLGAEYGKVNVAGLTNREAVEKLLAELKKTLDGSKLAVQIEGVFRGDTTRDRRRGSTRSGTNATPEDLKRQREQVEAEIATARARKHDLQVQRGMPNARTTPETKRLDDDIFYMDRRIRMLENSLRESELLSGPRATIINPGYKLRINVAGTLPDAPIKGVYTVDPDGYVNLGAEYGKVRVSGMSSDEAQAAILTELKKTLKDPKIVITIDSVERRNTPDDRRSSSDALPPELQKLTAEERKLLSEKPAASDDHALEHDAGHAADVVRDDEVSLLRRVDPPVREANKTAKRTEEPQLQIAHVESMQKEIGRLAVAYEMYGHVPRTIFGLRGNAEVEFVVPYLLVVKGPHLGRKEFVLPSWPPAVIQAEDYAGTFVAPRRLRINNGEPLEIHIEQGSTPGKSPVRVSNIVKITWRVPGAPTEDIRYPKSLMKPFTAIHWEKERPQVEIEGRWYELLGIENRSMDDILEYAKKAYPKEYETKIENDLESLLKMLDLKQLDNLQIKLRRLDNGQLEAIDVRRTTDGAEVVQRSTVEEKPAANKSEDAKR